MPNNGLKRYLDIYKAAHNNAVDLLKEAEILFEHDHSARAYVLAFTALEEISKSQFAADVFTGLEKQENFDKFYKDHRRKISRMEWAHLDANSFPHNLKWIGPDRDDVARINPQRPLFQKRQTALFVEVSPEKKKITTPDQEVTRQEAKEIIRIVEVAIERIWEVSGEFGGNQIGTKGFMK